MRYFALFALWLAATAQAHQPGHCREFPEVFAQGGVYSYALTEDCARIAEYPRIMVNLPLRGRLLKEIRCGAESYVVVGDILGDFPETVYTLRRRDVIVTPASEPVPRP